jgi:hypothetical protein
MIANALQVPYGQRMPAIDDQGSHLLQTGMVSFGVAPLPDPVGECLRGAGRQARPRGYLFPLVMAAVSVACEVGRHLLANALLAWFGVTLDPFVQCVALQVVVALIGIGLVGRFGKAPDPDSRWQMVLTLAAAFGIGLILTWLGRSIGCTDALRWPLVLAYLLWAWAAATSAV